MVDRDGPAREGRRKPVNGRRKGADYERELADYFVSLGYADARRMIRTGTKKHADEGDLTGLPFTVQAKTQKASVGDAQLAVWREQARTQRITNDHGVGLLVIKRNGHVTARSWAHVLMPELVYLTGASYRLIADCMADRETWACMSLNDLAPMLVRRYPPG
jgi:hypothetical protein